MSNLASCAPVDQGAGDAAEPATATDELWTALEQATRAVADAQTTLERHDATLPAEARLDEVRQAILAGNPLSKSAAGEYARRRGAEAMRLEEALGDALERESALERQLVECVPISPLDVARKLDTLSSHIDADESDWSMKVIRRAQADLGGLAGMPVAPISDPDDPAVAAFDRWRKAREAELDFYRRSPELVGDDCPPFLALEEAAMEAERALANTVATTPAGLAGQIRLAFRIFGELKPDRLGIGPDDYEVPDGMKGGGGAELLRSMLAGAEHMTGEPPDR